ncbi:MAG: DUF3014 domain-containing protein [Myxococcaceae bacterium]
MDDWRPPESEEPIQKKSKAWLWALLAVLVVGAGGFALWRVLQQQRGQEDTAEADTGATTGDAGPAVSLSEGDALLRKLLSDLGASPDLLLWIAGDDIIRRIAGAVNMVAEGDSPRTMLTFIELKGPYSFIEKHDPKAKKVARKKPPKRKGKHAKPMPEHTGKLFVSPQGWARYDAVTQAFTSVDAAGAGKAYGQLRPFFDAAFAEIGRPGRTFDTQLTAALDRLLAVKFPQGEVELVQKGALYEYKDPALEGLRPAEKHLLRMGPTNGKAVQGTLRRFGEAAGLPIQSAAATP